MDNDRAPLQAINEVAEEALYRKIKDKLDRPSVGR
jgi:hypothetical protein